MPSIGIVLGAQVERTCFNEISCFLRGKNIRTFYCFQDQACQISPVDGLINLRVLNTIRTMVQLTKVLNSKRRERGEDIDKGKMVNNEYATTAVCRLAGQSRTLMPSQNYCGLRI